MIFKDLLLCHTDDEILCRMAELFLDPVVDDVKDYSDGYAKLLTHLRKTQKPLDEDCDSYKLFAYKYENPWDLPEDKGFKPYLYEVFLYCTDDEIGENQIPYGLTGISPMYFEIYPPSLEILSKLDFICHTLHETGIYGEDLLEDTYSYKDEEDDDEEESSDTEYYSYEEIKERTMKEIEEECKEIPGLKEEIDRRSERHERLLDEFFENRVKLMADIYEFYKKR